jgi:HSP20 family protein
MTDRNWLPKAWFGDGDGEHHPLGALRKQIDTMFDEFDRGLPAFGSGFDVRSNVSETEKEVRITAELPGISMDDVDVSVVGRRIAVSGEKKSETEEKPEDGRQFHRIERRAGAFRREMTLPFEIDPDSVTAETKDGVLTVIIPKPPEEVARAKKIEIRKAG